jgi:hypothetical protein
LPELNFKVVELDKNKKVLIDFREETKPKVKPPKPIEKIETDVPELWVSDLNTDPKKQEILSKGIDEEINNYQMKDYDRYCVQDKPMKDPLVDYRLNIDDRLPKKGSLISMWDKKFQD